MKCGFIAALSYADQASETADSIASAALSSCRPEMMDAVAAQAESARKRGVSMTREHIELTVMGAAKSSLHDFVIKMRGLAKQRGPSFYREAAERISRGS